MRITRKYKGEGRAGKHGTPLAEDNTTEKRSPGGSEGFEIKEATYGQLFMEFLTLGLFTIGGGAAMMAVLQDRVSDKRHWMTVEETLDCIAVSQSLPGVLAINMSVYVGFRKKGFPGALVSWFGMILPSFVIILLIAMALGNIGDNIYIKSALKGISAAALGLIAFAVYKMIRQTLFSGRDGRRNLPFNVIMMVASFLAVAVMNVDAVLSILAAIVIGIVYVSVIERKASAAGNGGEEK